MSWWVQPLVRFIAAALLPLAVPAVIVVVLWVLPGDPAEMICAREVCGSATDALAERWHVDRGPWHFYTWWLGRAATLEFGNSWHVMQGFSVGTLLAEALPTTAALILLSVLGLTVGSVLSAMGFLPRRLDSLWQIIGLVPSVILALLFAAFIQVQWGVASHDGLPGTLRIVLGAFVLAVADGAFPSAVIGTRSVFEEEIKQRYIQIALLRGETPLANALPNVLPALVGQFRARALHVMSGAVIVEVVLRINGLGDLLWAGTLKQDFAVVLAATWAISLLSAFLLFVQASSEVAIALYVRWSPSGVADEVPVGAGVPA